MLVDNALKPVLQYKQRLLQQDLDSKQTLQTCLTKTMLNCADYCVSLKLHEMSVSHGMLLTEAVICAGAIYK